MLRIIQPYDSLVQDMDIHEKIKFWVISSELSEFDLHRRDPILDSNLLFFVTATILARSIANLYVQACPIWSFGRGYFFLRRRFVFDHLGLTIIYNTIVDVDFFEKGQLLLI